MAINNKKQYMTHQKYNILYNRVTIGWIQRQWCFKNKLNQNLKKKKTFHMERPACARAGWIDHGKHRL